MIDPDVQAVCEEFGVRIIPANVAPRLSETRAPTTLERMKRKYGLDHMRFVVGLLAETDNNRAILTEEIYWATSDIVLAFKKNFPAVISHETTKLYEFFDATPIGQLQFWCLDLEGITSKRRALVGMLWERAVRKFGPLATQPDLLDDRRSAA
ncbi:MAG TPA: hypothetical protein VGC14_02505 [Rhizobium sp.]